VRVNSASADRCTGVQAPSGILPTAIRIPRGTIIVRSQQAAHLRQPWSDRNQPDQNRSGLDQLDDGLAPLDGSTQARLRQRRWREPRHDRRQHWLAIVVAVLLHALFVVAIWYGMRPRQAPTVAHRANEVLRIRFIARSPTAVVEPPPAQNMPPPPKPRTRPRPPEPAAKDAMTLQLPTPKPVTARLYDEHGQPLLPATAASAPEPGYVQNLPQGDARVMQHTDPIKYKATRFEKYFPPPDETAGGAAVRHVVDAVVKSKDVDLPKGVHLKCMTVLGIPTPNCINPPAPPSAKDGDERLSMAPARSLDGEAHAPKPPSVEVCIAMYRAGKPLESGCPVDTPNRSVDAELRERAAGAARGH
jgi:hypothetical protein